MAVTISDGAMSMLTPRKLSLATTFRHLYSIHKSARPE